MLSINLHRRHLNESQQAMVGARLANIRMGDNQHKKEGASIEATSQSAKRKCANVRT